METLAWTLIKVAVVGAGFVLAAVAFYEAASLLFLGHVS